MYTPTSIYGLSSKARCLCGQSVQNNSEQQRSVPSFLIATLSLTEENEIHQVEVIEDNPDSPIVQVVGVYSHPLGQVWAISPSPVDSSLFFTCHSNAKAPESRGTLLRIQDASKTELEEVVHLPHPPEGSPIKGVIWHPSSGDSFIILGSNQLTHCTLDQGSVQEKTAIRVGDGHRVTTGKWNPLRENVIASVTEATIRCWDLRSSQETFRVEKAHIDNVRDLDFNPLNYNYFATGGDDCLVKFWDIRKLSEPAKSMSGHSHWVWNVKYSPHHDELVVSSGSDCKVILWNVASISSRMIAKRVDDNYDDSSRNLPSADGKIKVYEEHEDSVYGLAWGTSVTSSLWSFASLSYDGRCVFNYVPREIADADKY